MGLDTIVPKGRIRNRVNERESGRRWYQNLKLDPIRYWAYIIKRRKIQARYRERIKHNFPKFEAQLEYHKKWRKAYCASKSRKYRRMLERRRVRRALNPFPFRERNNAYYQELKSNPEKYQTHLERLRAYAKARRERIKKDEVAYKEFKEKQMIYQRYWRIVKAQKQQEESV